MKIEKTNLELLNIFSTCSSYLEKNKEADTKFKKCVESISKQCAPLKEAYDIEVEDIRLDNCLTDDTSRKKILRNEKGGYEFNVDGTKAVGEQVKKLLEKKVIFHTRILEGNNDFVDTLTEEEKRFFNGLVFDEIDLDDFEKQFKD